MKLLPRLVLCQTLALASFAETPGAPATPPNPPAEPATPPAPATPPPATPPGTPINKNAKLLSGAELHNAQQLSEALQLGLRWSEVAAGKGKSNAALGAAGEKMKKENTDLWTPWVTALTPRIKDGKDIPQDQTKSEKSELDKLGKLKDDKWPAEFTENWARQTKKYTKSAESAAKGLTDPDLKGLADKIAKQIAAHSEELETLVKDVKKKK